MDTHTWDYELVIFTRSGDFLGNIYSPFSDLHSRSHVDSTTPCTTMCSINLVRFSDVSLVIHTSNSICVLNCIPMIIDIINFRPSGRVLPSTLATALIPILGIV